MNPEKAPGNEAGEVVPPPAPGPVGRRLVLALALGAGLGAVCLWGLPGNPSWSIRATLAVTLFAIALWSLEPIPFAQTALLLMVGYVALGAVPPAVAWKGFATDATFLIIAGMMIAQAVHATPLGRRLAFWLLARLGGTYARVLLGLLLLQVLLAPVVPSTAVRAAVLLPIAASLAGVLNLAPGSQGRRGLFFAVAVGSNTSAVGLLPAAVSNVLSAELIGLHLGRSVTYWDWLIYTWPLWLALVPISWWVISRRLPSQTQRLPGLRGQMEAELRAIGPFTGPERRLVAIMSLTLLLWMTDAIHGWPPSVAAMLGAVLLAFPGVGILSWRELARVDVGTVLVMGATLSIGFAMNESGAARYLAGLLATPDLTAVLRLPVVGVAAVAFITQVLHLGVSNVATSTVITVPIFMGLAEQVGASPLVFGLTAGVTSLFGFFLVMETIPNIMVHATGEITQRDFFRVGPLLTLFTFLATVAVAATWWQWLAR